MVNLVDLISRKTEADGVTARQDDPPTFIYAGLKFNKFEISPMHRSAKVLDDESFLPKGGDYTQAPGLERLWQKLPRLLPGTKNKILRDLFASALNDYRLTAVRVSSFKLWAEQTEAFVRVEGMGEGFSPEQLPKIRFFLTEMAKLKVGAIEAEAETISSLNKMILDHDETRAWWNENRSIRDAVAPPFRRFCKWIR